MGVLNFFKGKEEPKPEANVPDPSIAGDLTSAGLTDTALFRDVRMNRQGDNVAVEPSDWEDFGPSRASYSSATVLNLSRFDGTKYFQIGDKIKLEQNSLTKYFYVIGVTSSTLTLTAGTTYTLTNHTIEYFARSRVVNPAGFPHWFSYTPTISVASGTISISGSGSVTAQFQMTAGLVYCNVLRTSVSLGGSGTGEIDETLPITADVPGTQLIYPVYCVGPSVTHEFMDWRILSATPTVIRSQVAFPPPAAAWAYSIWYPVI